MKFLLSIVLYFEFLYTVLGYNFIQKFWDRDSHVGGGGEAEYCRDEIGNHSVPFSSLLIILLGIHSLKNNENSDDERHLRTMTWMKDEVNNLIDGAIRKKVNMG